MHFHVITIFPELFESYLAHSILGRAIREGKIRVTFLNPRDFCTDKHRRVDDEPYGGGPGMVMKAEPMIRAWEHAVERIEGKGIGAKVKKVFGLGEERNWKTILFSAGGEQFTNEHARSYAETLTDLILICGRYEGIDERVREVTGAQPLSIGPYILTGGELPALVLIDAISRQVPGVLGTQESLEEERTASHAVYTRPAKLRYRGKEYPVPEVLLSGNHAKIEEWRREH